MELMLSAHGDCCPPFQLLALCFWNLLALRVSLEATRNRIRQGFENPLMLFDHPEELRNFSCVCCPGVGLPPLLLLARWTLRTSLIFQELPCRGRNLGQVSVAACKFKKATRELIKFKSDSKLFIAWRKGYYHLC